MRWGDRRSALVAALDRIQAALPPAAAHWGQAARGGGRDGSGTSYGMPAQGLAMWMWRGLIGRISEHVVEEAQETVEALRR